VGGLNTGDRAAGDLAIADQHGRQDTGCQQHNRHDPGEKPTSAVSW
jgi:hypothetical protein